MAGFKFSSFYLAQLICSVVLYTLCMPSIAISIAMDAVSETKRSKNRKKKTTTNLRSFDKQIEFPKQKTIPNQILFHLASFAFIHYTFSSNSASTRLLQKHIVAFQVTLFYFMLSCRFLAQRERERLGCCFDSLFSAKTMGHLKAIE